MQKATRANPMDKGDGLRKEPYFRLESKKRNPRDERQRSRGDPQETIITQHIALQKITSDLVELA